MELLALESSKRKIATTVFGNSFSYGISRVGIWFLDLSIGIVLARFLLPADYSLFALALFYFSFFARLEQLDLDNALMSTRENLTNAMSTHRIMRLGLSFAVLLLSFLWLLTPWGKWPIGSLMIGLAACGIFESLISTKRVALEIQFKVTTLALVEMFSTFLGVVVAVSIAFLGGGFWALLGYRATNLVSRALLIQSRASVQIGWKWDTEIARYFFKLFGLPVLAASLFTIFLMIQIPLIQYFAGASELGYYVKAMEAVLVPMVFLGLLVRVIGPVYSHYQSQNDLLKEAFHLVQLVKLRIAVPLYFMLFCFSSQWIHLLYGKAWLPMDKLFKVMLFYSILRLFFDDLLSLFSLGLKKPFIFRRLEIGQGLLSLLITPFLIWKLGAMGGALSLVLVYIFSVLLGWIWVKRKIEVSLKLVCVPILNLFIVSSVVFLTLSAFGIHQDHPAISFILLGMTLAGCSYFFEFETNKRSFQKLFHIGRNFLFHRSRGEMIS